MDGQLRPSIGTCLPLHVLMYFEQMKEELVPCKHRNILLLNSVLFAAVSYFMFYVVIVGIKAYL